jgi:two-component system, chemotaxis family, protein-glutamate methylesterase/glutaminase
MADTPVRVLIVDDSPVVRGVLKKMLARDSAIEVIGTAADPYEAREKIVELRPDVVTLDIEMPRMDGLTFLEKLMKHFPTPVIMCSRLTLERADLVVRATELGAVDVLSKPSSTNAEGLKELAIELVDKVKAAAKVNVKRPRRKLPPGTTDEKGRPLGVTATPVGRVRGMGYAHADVLPAPPALARNRSKLIVIGASTGGTEALRVVLERLPSETPPILIVQHMPEYFTLAFANRLNSLCEIEVREAKDGDALHAGLALVAPGNSHLMVRKVGMDLRASVRSGPLVCRHRPSVEVLFQSAANVAGPRTVAAILTGMGADGANGMALLKTAGARTVAQDEASCVVYGMPKEAVRCGGVDRVEHLERISQALLDLCCER